MSRPRRSRNLPIAQPADQKIDDLLLPVSGPNAVPPDKMTPRERMNEIVAILARGLLRRLHGIPPFVKPPNATAPPSRVT